MRLQREVQRTAGPDSRSELWGGTSKRIVGTALISCLAALVLAFVGCVNVRSAAFVCSTDADCDTPRVCESSWCVVPGGGGDGDGVGGGIDAGIDAGTDAGNDADIDAGPAGACAAPDKEGGRSVDIAAEYDDLYVVYELGKVPGVPTPLGGVTLKRGAPGTMLLAGNTESAEGGVYEIAIERGPCGHIIDVQGRASRIADTPFVDASLAYAPGRDLIVYSEFPRYTLSQLPAGASMPAIRTDLTALGLPTAGDDGPGGVGFVPPGFGPAAGELRIVTWPAGAWYHVGAIADGSLLDITSLTHVTDLPNTPGGFAYVPANSPGFPTAAVLVSEWNESDPGKSRVAVYDVDAAGDPIPETRREFLRKSPGSWGVYIDPVSGDLLLASFGTGSDELYVVQGFAPQP